MTRPILLGSAVLLAITALLGAMLRGGDRIEADRGLADAVAAPAPGSTVLPGTLEPAPPGSAPRAARPSASRYAFSLRIRSEFDALSEVPAAVSERRVEGALEIDVLEEGPALRVLAFSFDPAAEEGTSFPAGSIRVRVSPEGRFEAISFADGATPAARELATGVIREFQTGRGPAVEECLLGRVEAHYSPAPGGRIERRLARIERLAALVGAPDPGPLGVSTSGSRTIRLAESGLPEIVEGDETLSVGGPEAGFVLRVRQVTRIEGMDR